MELLGPNFLQLILIAMGGAMMVGSLVALINPPESDDSQSQNDVVLLGKRIRFSNWVKMRLVLQVAGGLIVCSWALASLT